MLRAILSNRLSSNNEAKENRSLHKTPSKKTLNKTINNKSLKNSSSTKKLSKLQTYNSDFNNALNIISDDKELIKQNNLKTPLKISQQRAPLSNIKKANIKEKKSLKSLNSQNQQLKKTPHSLKKKSSSQLFSVTSPSLKINNYNLHFNNNKIHNENENSTSLKHNHTLKRQNSISLSTSSAPLSNMNNNNSNLLKRTKSFEINQPIQIEPIKENIFLTRMKNNMKEENINTKKSQINNDIEYMPPSLIHLEEEVEPKYKINYEELLKYKPATIIDSDIFKRINSDVDIELDSNNDALKANNFEFVDDFIIDLNPTNKTKAITKQENNIEKENQKNGTLNDTENKNNNDADDNDKDDTNLILDNKDNDSFEKEKEKKEMEKALQQKLSQDFNLSFGEASEDEEIKLPDFLTTDDKDSLYFDEIDL